MVLTAPPDPFDPLRSTLRAGSILYRVHDVTYPSGPTGAATANPGNIPNPGKGRPSRFAFFGDPPVPVIYMADRPEAAVHETILHDAEPGSLVFARDYETKVLTVLEVVEDIEVAQFHSAGLRRFGLTAADLTDTTAAAYPESVLWAQAAYGIGLDGVEYACRHFNSALAYTLYGRPGFDIEARLRPLPGHGDQRTFALPEDVEWLAGIALQMKVTISI